MSTDLMVHPHLEGLSQGQPFTHEGVKYYFIRYVPDSIELSATPAKPTGAMPVRIEYMYKPRPVHDYMIDAEQWKDYFKDLYNPTGGVVKDDDSNWKAPAVGDDDDYPCMGEFDEEG